MPSKNSVNKAKNLKRHQHTSRAASARLRSRARTSTVIDPTTVDTTTAGAGAPKYAVVGRTRKEKDKVRGGRVAKTVNQGGILYGRVPSRKVQQKLAREKKLAKRAAEAATRDQDDNDDEEEVVDEAEEEAGEMEVDESDAPAGLFGRGATGRREATAVAKTTGGGTEIGGPRR